MHQRRRGVPWLHLLAEDDGETVGPDGVLADDWENLRGEVFENLCREGTAVVEVELKGVSCARDRRVGSGWRGELELVGCKLGRDSHCVVALIVHLLTEESSDCLEIEVVDSVGFINFPSCRRCLN